MRETNLRLGYPSDARLLIINADDFGMCHAVTDAIFYSITGGVTSSTTLMVPCAWAQYAMRLLGEHPEIPFGVHLTAIGDSLGYRWRPITSRERVQSLVDEAGFFYNSDRMEEFFAGVKIDEMEIEFRAQIESVLGAGLKPTHLDWHSVRIHRLPAMFDLMFGLAKEYGLALRVRERSSIETVQSAGFPSNDFDFLDSTMIESDGKPEKFATLLHDLPEGLSEWAVHPGINTPELIAAEPTMLGIRQADFDWLVSVEARNVIEKEGITVISYAPLQEVWREHTRSISS